MILPFIKKTSEDWNRIYMKKYKMRIYDEDGWNRKNFDYFWNREKITWKEFIRRSNTFSRKKNK